MLEVYRSQTNWVRFGNFAASCLDRFTDRESKSISGIWLRFVIAKTD
jgi:hypothetical protein